MDIEHLSWDSNFFNKKISRITIYDTDDINNLSFSLNKLMKENYDLVYVFSPGIISVNRKILNCYYGALRDIKLVYKKLITNREEAKTSNIIEWSSSYDLHSLYKLGLASGVKSRFKLDENFTDNEFEQLYKTWIDNSINNKIADKVFICFDNTKFINGFVTVKINKLKGTIGLIAVNEEARGKKIGSGLIKHVENFLFDKGIPELYVATQSENLSACKFYEINGMFVHSTTNIYHFWLNNI